MLSKPKGGWSSLTHKNISGGAVSYLDDVPSMMIDAFFTRIIDKDNRLSLTFDAEGQYTDIIEIDGNVFFTTHFDKPENAHEDIHGQFVCFSDDIPLLASELCDDLSNDMQTWMNEWYVFDSESEKSNRSSELKQMISNLRLVISSYNKKKSE